MRDADSLLISCVFALTLSYHGLAWPIAVGSTSVSPSSANPGAPVLIDIGSFYYPGNVNSMSQVFYTNKACAANFTPYITLDMNRIDMYTPNFDNSLSAVMAYGTCVQTISPYYTVYQVVYLATLRYYDLRHDSFTHLGATPHLSTTDGAYGWPNLVNVPNMMEVKDTAVYYKDAYDGPRNLTWRLYCYPPSLSPPLNQTTIGNNTQAAGCKIGSNPYNT